MHLLSGAPTRPLEVVVLEPMLLLELYDEPKPECPSVAALARSGGAAAVYVYRRDGADALLAWLLAHGPPIAFWTHERAAFARAAMRRAFPDAWRARRFFRSRRSCTVFDETYVKDVRRLRATRRLLLVDFTAAQVRYHLAHAIRAPLLLAADSDLRRVLQWFRRRGGRGAVHV